MKRQKVQKAAPKDMLQAIYPLIGTSIDVVNFVFYKAVLSKDIDLSGLTAFTPTWSDSRMKVSIKIKGMHKETTLLDFEICCEFEKVDFESLSAH